ncbi:sporulation membrane protein YtaF [Fodinisporobacter ferrooxydans]|uniref:Sporulation membrane protein YtaF n=1 Tax=Fodinisporobacter ferrooxydans TaxID=2901836 RepID=A0ABY4CNH1_9BACL|nr:sporulation membrane protein YtaF [Alicyclobacillaceae bacterium MYW30-H2]
MHESNLFNIIMIGIAANLDNAGVGISYGIRDIQVPWYSNAMIAIMSALATLAAGIAGKWIGLWISPRIGTILGTILLILVGFWVMLQPFFEKASKASDTSSTMIRILQNPEAADSDKSKTISLAESIVLGAALAINALAGGFDAGVIQLNIFLTAFSVGIFSYVLFGISIYIGKTYVAGVFGNKATYIAGILLIFIGLHQLF